MGGHVAAGMDMLVIIVVRLIGSGTVSGGESSIKKILRTESGIGSGDAVGATASDHYLRKLNETATIVSAD